MNRKGLLVFFKIEKTNKTIIKAVAMQIQTENKELHRQAKFCLLTTLSNKILKISVLHLQQEE